MHFWLHWVIVAECRFSLVAASRSFSLVAVCGLLTAVASLVSEPGLQGTQAQQLRRVGLVAWQHVGSSYTRDQTNVPCIARPFLTTGPTGEALCLVFFPSVCV